MKSIHNHLRSEYRSLWRKALSIDAPGFSESRAGRDLVWELEDGEGPCGSAVRVLLADWDRPGPARRGDSRLWAAVLRGTRAGERPAEIAARLGLSSAAVSRLLSKRIRPAIRREMELQAREQGPQPSPSKFDGWTGR